MPIFNTCYLCEGTRNDIGHDEWKAKDPDSRRELVREKFASKSMQIQQKKVAQHAINEDISREEADGRRISAVALHENPDRYRRHKPDLFRDQKGICCGCLAKFRYRNLTVDHILSWKTENGSDDPENLQLLCGACNAKKGDGSNEDLFDALHKEAVKGIDADPEWVATLEARPKWTIAKKGKRRK